MEADNEINSETERGYSRYSFRYIDTNERLFNTLDEVVSIIESVEEDSDGITAINIIDTLNDNIALQSQALEANERIMELINVI